MLPSDSRVVVEQNFKEYEVGKKKSKFLIEFVFKILFSFGFLRCFF